MMKNVDNAKAMDFKEYCFLVLMGVMFVLAVGFRPDFVGTDTASYIYHYDHFIESNNDQHYGFLIAFIIRCCLYFSGSATSFFVLLALINLALIYCLGRYLYFFLEEKSSFYCLLCLLGIFFCWSPFFFAVTGNVIRSGPTVFSVFLFLLIIECRQHWRMLFPLLMMVVGFHWITGFVLIFSPLLFLRYKTILGIILIASVCYLTGMSEKILQWISILTSIDIYSPVNNYAVGHIAYHRGVRWNFALFTLFTGFLFQKLSQYALSKETRVVFLRLLKVYWVLTVPFFLFGFASFSDRFLLPAWLFLSILSAVFCELYLRTKQFSMNWIGGMFFLSSLYFLCQMQGIIGGLNLSKISAALGSLLVWH